MPILRTAIAQKWLGSCVIRLLGVSRGKIEQLVALHFPAFCWKLDTNGRRGLVAQTSADVFLLLLKAYDLERRQMYTSSHTDVGHAVSDGS